MIHISIKQVRVLLAGLIFSAGMASGMNLLNPYDPLIRPSYTNRYRTQWALFAETGVNTKAFNAEGCSVNPLRIWQPQQNALAMLDGFCVGTSVGQFREKLNVDDNGVRGHFCVAGDLDLRAAAAFSARFFFANDWSIGIYLPAFSMKLKDVLWVDQTEISDNPQDILTRQCLTDDIFQVAYTFGQGLELGGWERTGLGDATLLLEWFRDFPQQRPFLKNARLNWRLGIMFPTGKPWDENKIMAVPFGNDGAFAIPFGLGLDLTFGRYIRGGLDVQLTHIFGNTRERRIKVDLDQTELLLLQKSHAYKDFGLLQRFELYFEFYRILAGFSCKVGYEYFKKGDDTFSSADPLFFNTIANTAERLEELTMHTMVVNAWYDFGYNKPDMRARPEISLFSRIPFNGKRSVQNTTIGGRVSVDF
jgi:hypothetical protein